MCDCWWMFVSPCWRCHELLTCPGSTFPTKATGMELVIENGWMVTLLFQVKLDSRVFQTIGKHHASSMEAYKYMATNGLHCFGTGRDPEWLCGLEYDTRASTNKLLGRQRDEEARAMLGVWLCSKNSCSVKCFLIKENKQQHWRLFSSLNHL